MGVADCRVWTLPLDAGRVGSPGIAIFVKRLPATAPRRGVLWLLAGGPGGAGDDLEWLADALSFLVPDLDIYLPDHRGTGRSGRLGCAAEGVGTPGGRRILDSERAACGAELRATWGQDLAAFTPTAAAQDLQALIADTRQPGDKLYVAPDQRVKIW